jgi:hypothetical protein
MQLKYNLGPIPGVPGQLLDLNAVGLGDIVTAIAGALIPPGIDCELNAAGLLVPVSDLTASWPPPGTAGGTAHYGVSIYDLLGFEQGLPGYTVPPSTAGSTGTGYPLGSAVPILRKGRIWMQYDGGGVPLRVGQPNVWHSSDGSHPQGVLTFSAVSAVVGAEIGAAVGGMNTWNPNLTAGMYTDGFGVSWGICAVSLNLS